MLILLQIYIYQSSQFGNLGKALSNKPGFEVNNDAYDILLGFEHLLQTNNIGTK